MASNTRRNNSASVKMSGSSARRCLVARQAASVMPWLFRPRRSSESTLWNVASSTSTSHSAVRAADTVGRSRCRLSQHNSSSDLDLRNCTSLWLLSTTSTGPSTRMSTEYSTSLVAEDFGFTDGVESSTSMTVISRIIARKSAASSAVTPYGKNRSS